MAQPRSGSHHKYSKFKTINFFAIDEFVKIVNISKYVFALEFLYNMSDNIIFYVSWNAFGSRRIIGANIRNMNDPS